VLLDAFNQFLDDLNPYKPEQVRAQGGVPVDIEDSPVRQRLVRVIVIAFVTFLAWATLAPIDAGVAMSGTVVVYGNRKAVQHPSGGVVSRILVREGSQVKQGDTLIQLNPLTLQANLNSTELEYIGALAIESRLVSESEGHALRWLPELEAMKDDPRVVDAKRIQQMLYESRQKDIKSQKQILQEQLDGYTQQLVELKSLMDARQKQLSLVSEDARNNQELANEGYVPRSKAHDLERNRHEVLANIATSNSDRSKLLATIAATRLQLNQIDVAQHKEVEGQLTDIQRNRMSLKNKVDSLRFDLSLTDLKAPVDGIVVGLKTSTEGGVIQGGQVLMEIVPVDTSLIVEAQIPPHMIDKVRVGMEADMRFSAFNTTTTPVVPGLVKLVGADKLTPASGNGEAYYLAQIETTSKTRELLGEHEIQPGMPVEVIVKTGERSFMSYLLKPLSDRFARAFKEN
jgi:protease secretion system membrane fusion protein